jgi:selenide,water dikinase
VFPGVREMIAAGAVPGGTARNVAAAAAFTSWPAATDDTTRTLLCDAQTSGGLLMAVDPGSVGALLAALRDAGTPAAVEVGEVTETSDPILEIVHDRT